MIKWIWLITLTAKIAACYAPVPIVDIDIEESRKDQSLVRLARSKSIYDNVGILYRYIIENDETTNPICPSSCGSAVYIGGKFGKGFCLASAHCCFKFYYFSEESGYEVGFEIGDKKVKRYRVKDFFVHPKYKQFCNYDLAILVLDGPVEGLEELKINYEFSKQQVFEDYQHLLTYVGYGVKLFGNNWFTLSDEKRRARQCYTHNCSMKPQSLGIYSTPYKHYNNSKTTRDLGAFEVYSREGMSGAAVINEKDELVSITKGTKTPVQPFNIMTSLYFILAYFSNCILTGINVFCCPAPLFNTGITIPGAYTQSVPLGACRDWIESVQRQYGEAAHIV